MCSKKKKKIEIRNTPTTALYTVVQSLPYVIRAAADSQAKYNNNGLDKGCWKE